MSGGRDVLNHAAALTFLLLDAAVAAYLRSLRAKVSKGGQEYEQRVEVDSGSGGAAKGRIAGFPLLQSSHPRVKDASAASFFFLLMSFEVAREKTKRNWV